MNPSLDTLNGAVAGVLEFIRLGGPVVAILLAMSILALAVILLKLWQFARNRVGDRRTPATALKMYRVGGAERAVNLARRSRNPAAQVLARAIRGHHATALSEERVREELLRYGNARLESLRSHFRVLEVIASLAPLLGLFGTVLGMIQTFRALEAAGAQVNPAILSGGVWQALLTTAVGLAVAMPVIVVLTWLERRVDRLAHDMDNVVTQVFTEDLAHTPVPLATRDDAAPALSAIRG